jgi:hypothetical protein
MSKKLYSKNKSNSSFNLFLYKLDIILFKFLANFSKKNRKRKAKRNKESLKLTLHKYNYRLFKFKKWFTKESRYYRRKKRKEFFRYIKFRINIFYKKIAYWNSKEIREIRRKNRKKAWNFFIEKRRFFFELYVYRIYKSLVDIKKWLKDIENRKSFITNIITSSILFIIAYFFTYFLYQLATSLMARAYNIHSVIYFFKTDFLIRSYSNLWTRNNVILISFIGPMVSLVIGFILFRVFHFFRKKPGLAKLFFLWCTLHSFNMFFGAYIAGVLTNKGFGLVMLWLFFQLLLNISFTFICVILLIVIGSISAKPFLQTAHHSSLISESNRTYFLVGQAFIPYIIGNIFIFLISLPDVKPYQAFILAVMGFIIVPVILKPNYDKLKIVKEDAPLRINVKLIVAFIIMVLIFRFGLGYGFKI